MAHADPEYGPRVKWFPVGQAGSSWVSLHHGFNITEWQLHTNGLFEFVALYVGLPKPTFCVVDRFIHGHPITDGQRHTNRLFQCLVVSSSFFSTGHNELFQFDPRSRLVVPVFRLLFPLVPGE